MDTPEKLKALHEHCDRNKTCQSCILNGACCLNYIDDKITGMYENIKTQQNAAKYIIFIYIGIIIQDEKAIFIFLSDWPQVRRPFLRFI